MLSCIQCCSLLQSHYRCVAHNVSQEELKQGADAYNDVRRTYDEGRQAINKNNILKIMHSFWHAHLKPLPIPPDHLLKYMLASGTYIPAPVWCYSSQGKGLDYNRFTAMWNLIRDGVEKVSIMQARLIFFEYKSSDLALAEDALWEGSLQSAIQGAQGLRAANDVQDQADPSSGIANGGGGVSAEGQQDIFPHTEDQQQELSPQRLLDELAELDSEEEEEYQSEEEEDLDGSDFDASMHEDDEDEQPSYASD